MSYSKLYMFYFYYKMRKGEKNFNLKLYKKKKKERKKFLETPKINSFFISTQQGEERGEREKERCI